MENLTLEQRNNLQEFHRNLEMLSYKLDDFQMELVKSNSKISHNKIQYQLSDLLKETLMQNEEIISQF